MVMSSEKNDRTDFPYLIWMKFLHLLTCALFHWPESLVQSLVDVVRAVDLPFFLTLRRKRSAFHRMLAVGYLINALYQTQRCPSVSSY